MNLVTRRQWAARSASGRPPLNAARLEGVAVHYTGASNAYEKADHAACALAVRSVQNFHMDGRGWWDIAYNFLVCRHGYVFEGRGWGIRSAAQGSTPGNDGYHAVCFLGNDDSGVADVTPEASSALVAVILEAQRRYEGADDVQPHSHFAATSCPGNELRAWIAQAPWRTAKPQGFWQWLNWYEGRSRYQGHARDPELRPDVPAKIPADWWGRRSGWKARQRQRAATAAPPEEIKAGD